MQISQYIKFLFFPVNIKKSANVTWSYCKEKYSLGRSLNKSLNLKIILAHIYIIGKHFLKMDQISEFIYRDFSTNEST